MSEAANNAQSIVFTPDLKLQSREPQAMRLQPRDISLYELFVIALFEALLA